MTNTSHTVDNLSMTEASLAANNITQGQQAHGKQLKFKFQESDDESGSDSQDEGHGVMDQTNTGKNQLLQNNQTDEVSATVSRPSASMGAENDFSTLTLQKPSKISSFSDK